MEILDKYINILLNPENPIFISLLITIISSILIFFVFKSVVLPLQKRHLEEKHELELKKSKMMALFSELAPDPVLRCDADGKILSGNSSASRLTADRTPEGLNLFEIISNIDIDLKKVIYEDQLINLNEQIGSRYYSISVRGISFENSAQIYFHDLTDRKKSEEKLQRSRNQLKELSDHLFDKLEEERQRIGRELHDVIGQNLLLMKMNIHGGGNGADLSALLENTISDLREIMYDLKPKILEEMGLGAALKSIAEKVSANTGIEGTADILGQEERLDEKLEIFIFRIVQESLNNIVKHSKARTFNIQLINKDETVLLMVSDDGIGFETGSQPTGMGLLNMKERVESYQGKFKIDSSPDEGTIIIAELPKIKSGINAEQR